MDNTRPKTRGNKARDAGRKGKKGTRKRSSEQGDGQRGAKRTKRDQPADNVGIGYQDMTQTCKDMMANMNLMMTNMNKFFATKALSQDPVTIEDTDAAGEVAGAEANEASEDTGLFNTCISEAGTLGGCDAHSYPSKPVPGWMESALIELRGNQLLCLLIADLGRIFLNSTMTT
ncbi:uncharacterized protein LOC135489286 [Lineus longissimus]|uniref:uncharacterized protein LOC135489286 n=1 Tax=Lineus longissimus TaxID=88925 RepID=UPI00315DB0D7